MDKTIIGFVKNKISNIDSEKIYILALALCFFGKGTGLSKTSIFYWGLLMLSGLMLTVKIIYSNWNLQDWIGIAIVAILITINYLLISNTALLFSFILLLGLKDVSIDKIWKPVFYAMLTGFSLRLLAFMFHLLPDKTIYFWRASTGYITRHSLSFEHSNIPGLLIFILCCLCFLSYWEELPLWLPLLFLVAACPIYYFTGGRGGFMALILLLGVFYISKIPPLKIILSLLGIIIQPLLLILTYLIVQLHDTPIFNTLNRILTGRLSYSYLQLKSPPTLLGKITHSDILFDNSYSLLLCSYGIIITLLLISVYVWVNLVLYKEQYFMYNIIFLIISIHMFVESYYPNFIFNLSLIVIASYLFNGKILHSNTKTSRHLLRK